jgi:hypothetical protein
VGPHNLHAPDKGTASAPGPQRNTGPPLSAWAKHDWLGPAYREMAASIATGFPYKRSLKFTIESTFTRPHTQQWPPPSPCLDARHSQN